MIASVCAGFPTTILLRGTPPVGLYQRVYKRKRGVKKDKVKAKGEGEEMKRISVDFHDGSTVDVSLSQEDLLDM